MKKSIQTIIEDFDRVYAINERMRNCFKVTGNDLSLEYLKLQEKMTNLMREIIKLECK